MLSPYQELVAGVIDVEFQSDGSSWFGKEYLLTLLALEGGGVPVGGNATAGDPLRPLSALCCLRG